jgi:hypothetical protein
MQVVFKTNLGTIDAKKFGLDYKKCQKAMTVDVSADLAAELKERNLVLSPEEAKNDELIQSALGVSKEEFTKTVKGEAKSPAIKGVEEESPVSNENAAEAIADIGNMRSKEKLQHIVDNDPRVTVKEAAKKRLASL